MYRCEICRNLIGPNVPSHKVIVETRAVAYPFRREANRFIRKRKAEKRDDPGGGGVEIVREAIVCPNCATKKP